MLRSATPSLFSENLKTKLGIFGLALLASGCVLLHNDPNGEGGGVASSVSAGGGGAGGDTGGAGGLGGAGGAGTCPEDFDLFLSNNISEVTASFGAVSATGHAWVAGTFTGPGAATTVTFGEHTFDFSAEKDNFYVALRGTSGLSGITVQASASTAPGSPSLTHLVATSDGGAFAAFRGSAFVLPASVGALPALDNTSTEDALIVKLDSSGAYQWHLQLEAGVDPLSMDAVQVGADGALLIGGSVGDNSAAQATGSLLVRFGDTGALNEHVNVFRDSAPKPSLFLLKYVGPTEYEADVFPGRGTLTSILERNGSRYLAGSYVDESPDFGGSTLPGAPSVPQLFVVKFDGPVLSQQQSFGFNSRADDVLDLLDTGTGLALVGVAAPSASDSTTFVGLDAGPVLAENQGASYILRLDNDLEPITFDMSFFTGPVKVQGGFVSSKGELVVGHRISPGSQINVADIAYTSPQTGSLFMSTGAEIDPLQVFAVLPKSTAVLRAFGHQCGELVVGTHGGESFDLLNATVPEITGNTGGLMMFRKAGLPFGGN